MLCKNFVSEYNWIIAWHICQASIKDLSRWHPPQPFRLTRARQSPQIRNSWVIAYTRMITAFYWWGISLQKNLFKFITINNKCIALNGVPRWMAWIEPCYKSIEMINHSRTSCDVTWNSRENDFASFRCIPFVITLSTQLFNVEWACENMTYLEPFQPLFQTMTTVQKHRGICRSSVSSSVFRIILGWDDSEFSYCFIVVVQSQNECARPTMMFPNGNARTHTHTYAHSNTYT